MPCRRTSHFLSLSTTLFCLHHFIMRRHHSLNPSFLYLFRFLFPLHFICQRGPHYFSSFTHSFSHTRTLFLRLPASLSPYLLSKTRDTSTGASTAPHCTARGRFDRERDQPENRAGFGERASERASGRVSATPWNPLALRGGRSAIPAARTFPLRVTYDHPLSLSLAIPIARDACCSPL